jgi:hypothetical protein
LGTKKIGNKTNLGTKKIWVRTNGFKEIWVRTNLCKKKIGYEKKFGYENL